GPEGAKRNEKPRQRKKIIRPISALSSTSLPSIDSPFAKQDPQPPSSGRRIPILSPFNPEILSPAEKRDDKFAVRPIVKGASSSSRPPIAPQHPSPTATTHISTHCRPAWPIPRRLHPS